MSFPQTFCATAYFLQHTMGCSGILKTGVATGGVWCPCNQAGAVSQAMLGSPTVPYCFVFLWQHMAHLCLGYADQ